MLDDAEIRTRLTNVFREVFDDETIEIHDAMTAEEIEEWDSLNHINLVIAVEGDFSVRFTTPEVGNLANVGEFVTLLTTKLAATS